MISTLQGKYLRLARLGIVAISIVAFASCSNQTPSAADKTFVQNMIPHHELGMKLIDDAVIHAADVRLRRLVFEMGNYHHDEMITLSRWQSDWHVSIAAQFPGHLTNTELESLKSVSGSSYDKVWLELMIKHHEGAVAIAESAIQFGQVQAVRKLAENIKVIQHQQIIAMRNLKNEM